MTSEQWKKAKEIFGLAMELESPQRDAFVVKASNGDLELLAEVMSLFEKDSPDAFFKNPIDGVLGSPVVLEGRYQLVEELGRGGFGVVYLARDHKMHDRQVVIKMPHSESLTDSWPAQKFEGEIAALARINHPGVVGALDRGVDQDGRPYFVMQFVDGRLLRKDIGTGGMALSRVAAISAQIGHALGAAHRGGVWHRDLKPENIMLQPLPEGGEQVVLIDFGIATVKEANDRAEDVETRAVGSPLYMAPEQFSGHVFQATDIYAFGLIVYEMLTGCKPFNATTAGERLAQQSTGAFKKPSLLRLDLPGAAEALLLSSLSYQPEKRPQDAVALGDALAQSLWSVPIPRRFTRRTAWITAIGAALAGITGLVWKYPIRFHPVPSLSCVFLVQKTMGGQSLGPPQAHSVDQRFQTGDRFLVQVHADQEGHLYLLSEEQGKDGITLLFPAPFMYGGSSSVKAGELKLIPQNSSFAFDEVPAVLVLWIVWSSQAIRQFDDLQKWMNENDRGALGDSLDRANVRATLAKLPKAQAVSADRPEQKFEISSPRFAWKATLETRR